MTVREKLYTVAEFLEMALLPENAGRRLELVNGAIVEMTPSSQKNTVAAGRMVYYLNAFVMPRDLGYITLPDGGFQLNEHTLRHPDAAYISKERHSALDGVAFPLAPNLAVEVVSPDEDIFQKANDYLQAGTRLVWAIYVEQAEVFAFTLQPDHTIRSVRYGADAVLDGGDVLPGFSVTVRDLLAE